MKKRNGNFLCVHTNGKRYDFNKFTTLEQLYYDILSGKTTIKQAKDEQKKIDKEILGLKGYGPTNQKKNRRKV